MTAPVEAYETAPEAAEAATVAAETPAPATETVETEKEVVDITAFQAAVDTLLGAPDGSDTDALVLAVRTEYHEFGRAGKTAARKLVEEGGTAAIMNSDLASAQTLLRLKDEMVKPLPTSGQPRAPKAPKNSAEEVVAHIAAIQLAYSLSMLAANSNSALDENWGEQVSEIATAEAQERAGAYAAWLVAKQEGPEPEASEVEKAAARVSLGRAPKGQGRKPKGVEEAAKAAADAEGTENEGETTDAADSTSAE